MAKRPSGGRRGKDDLDETLHALAARVQESAEKAQAARHIEEQIPRIAAMAAAVKEFNATKADVRREVQANLKEARQVGDLRRCVAFKQFLLRLEE
jgi:hypothetical protein